MATEITNSKLRGYIAKADAQGNGNGQIDTKNEKEVLFQFCDTQISSYEQQIKSIEGQTPKYYDLVEDYEKTCQNTSAVIGGIVGAIGGYVATKGWRPLAIAMGLVCGTLGTCVGYSIGGIIKGKATKKAVYDTHYKYTKQVNDLEKEKQHFEEEVNNLKTEYQSIG